MAAGYVIDMIDVGQGDAFIVATRTKAGIKNCLIDAGRKSAGSTVVRHLEKHYDGKLTYAVLTHVDDDHIGGFREVLAAGIHPQTVLLNDPRDALERFVKKGAVLLSEQAVQINASITTSDDIIKEIDRLGIKRRSAFAGEEFTLSAALTIEFLSPDRNAFPELVSKFNKRNREKLSERAPDARRACSAENDASVVCVATYDNEDLFDRALFTGDACLKTLKRVAKGGVRLREGTSSRKLALLRRRSRRDLDCRRTERARCVLVRREFARPSRRGGGRVVSFKGREDPLHALSRHGAEQARGRNEHRHMGQKARRLRLRVAAGASGELDVEESSR
jgi:hypothetical protein